MVERMKNKLIFNLICASTVIFCWIVSPFVETRNPALFHYLMGGSGMFYLMLMKVSNKENKGR